METSLQQERNDLIKYPDTDGRQTRIDFFSKGKSDAAAGRTKKHSFEWWHAISDWLKSSRHEREDHLDGFIQFLTTRNYSPKTCRSYVFMVRKFFDYIDEKDIKKISMEIIEDYNYDFFVIGRYSRPYQLQFINGLTLYLEYAEGVKVNLKGLRRTSSKR
ncbi:MAG: phage integrase N-terminal SAM-like domain-containing protein [Bacteroidales bacterium]|nr:phage integrase N-terminal SAM-like domain-containing protein [Bacteroidales bacterium]